MSLLSKTSFGTVYRLQTIDNEPPDWHATQCAILGFGENDDNDINNNNYDDDCSMQCDNNDTDNTYDTGDCNRVEQTWIVKVMNPDYRVCKRKGHKKRVCALGLGTNEDDDNNNADARTELRRSEERRIAREVALHAATGFVHPHIATAARAETVSGGCGLIVFRDEGLIDLFDYLQRKAHRPVSPAHACKQICEALAFLHSAFDLVHNDVKPENVLIDPATHHCLLTDFGGATAPQSAGAYELVTASRFFVAPERLRGDAYDKRADSWSLGMLCCELLATDHHNPFEQTYTRERWHRMMMQNFAEPLTESIWRRRLQQHNESDWAQWFLQYTLRIRPEDRWSADQLLNHDTKQWT